MTAHVNSVYAFCERAYAAYTSPRYLHPDPLELVRRYSGSADQEVVGLISSSLALGKVDLILAACESVLAAIHPPAETLAMITYGELRRRLSGFVYRFFRGERLASFLYAIGETLRREGSLEALFLLYASEHDRSLLPALHGFTNTLRSRCPADPGILLSDPAKGGAAKRLHMYLRWMVRKDALDLGVWSRLSPRQLLFPLDVHMHRIALFLGCTSRKTITAKVAEEVTDYFRCFSPEDPVKYDFALTRFGIHPELKKRFDLVEQARST